MAHKARPAGKGPDHGACVWGIEREIPTVVANQRCYYYTSGGVGGTHWATKAALAGTEHARGFTGMVELVDASPSSRHTRSRNHMVRSVKKLYVK